MQSYCGITNQYEASLLYGFICRSWAASSSLPGEQGSWLVSGGGDRHHSFNSVIVYNSSNSNGSYTNRWNAYNDLPIPLQDHCQISDGNNVFIIGGNNGNMILSTVYILNDGTWSVYHSLSIGRYYHVCVVMDGSGSNASYKPLDSVEILAPGGDGWVPGPALPGPVYGGQAGVYDDSIYVLGGENNKNIYRLDSGADHWVTEDAAFYYDRRSVFPAPLMF